MNFFIHIIFALGALSHCQEIEEAEIDYYENLINTQQEEALNFNYPTSARSYWNKTLFNRRNNFFGSFDYIIIGSGSAGSVVANRLSENKKLSILVLEAGGFENNFTDIPGKAFFAQGSNYNWQYTTVPQKNCCLGMVDKKCLYQRGKGFGGTSIINGLVYSRGPKNDYDRWAKQGNPGWSYKDVLPIYKKLENSHIDGDKGYHGFGGNVNVEYSKFYSEHLQAYLDANVELGRSIIDYNGKNSLGVSKAQFNTINGRRQSNGKAFINPALHRPNLYLSKNSYVTKILIGTISKTAYGVTFIKNNKKYVAFAKREIILSAGTISSPHILMLSGVGPKNHLRKHKIHVIKDLDVGNNLNDHPCYYGLNIETNISIPIKSQKDYIKDYLDGTGIFTLAGNNAGVGFFKTNVTTNWTTDVEIMLISPNRTDAYFQKGFGFTDEVYKALTADIDNSKTLTMLVYLLHPIARGTILLKSNNPFDYPLIDSKFFDDEDGIDLEIMYQGINLVLEMLNTNAFKKLNATLGKVVVPACENYKYLSREFWICSIKHISDNIYHPVGTCKMGPDPKLGAVVDHKLRVHGIQNLRVADGSVIPFSLGGHPNSPIVMVGEQVSNFIKETLR